MASKADELYTAIFAKGDEIKKLKAQKVEKAVLQPHIAELLDLKAKVGNYSLYRLPPLR